MSEPTHETEGNQVTAEIYHYIPEVWDKIKPDILRLRSAAQYDGVTKRPPDYYEAVFKDDDSYWLRVLLKQADRVIGFTLIHPEHNTHVFSDSNGFIQSKTNYSKVRAEVATTYIDSRFQHQRLVGKLMDVAEQELKSRGFEEIIRDAVSYNGYADAIKRHYGDRVRSSSLITPALEQLIIRL
jgi:hypothetical protein